MKHVYVGFFLLAGPSLFAQILSLDKATSIEGISLTQLTNWDGDETRPRFSPDGKQIVFAGGEGRQSKIFLMSLEDMKVKQLTTGPSTDSNPFFSSDGKAVGFNSDRGGSPQLWEQRIDGAIVTKLVHSDSILPYSGCWSPDGSKLLFTGLIKGKTHLFLKEKNSTQFSRFTKNGDEYHGKWSPDGKEIAYYTGVTDSLMVFNFESGKTRSVNRGRFQGWQPTFSPDSKWIAFISERKDHWDLWITDTLGRGEPTQITLGGFCDYPYWSPTSNSIVFSRKTTKNQHFSVSLDGLTIKQLSDAKFDQVDFTYSPNEDRRAYGMIAKGDELWIEENGRHWQVTNNLPGRVRSPAWSSDGKSVVFVNQTFYPNGSDTDIFVVSHQGGDTRQLTTLKAADNPLWHSNDTIYFSVKEPTGSRYQIYKISPQGGDPVPITSGSDSKILTDISADGNRMLYHAGYRVFIYNRRSETATEVAVGEGARFSRDGKWIAYRSNRNEEKSTDLYVKELSTGVAKRVTNSKIIESWPRWSADGGSLLYNADIGNKDIWMAKLSDDFMRKLDKGLTLK